MMEAATADLKKTGIESLALQVGDHAPDLVLPDATGRAVRLSDLWAKGPLVLIFYRGGWCPYSTDPTMLSTKQSCSVQGRACWRTIRPEHAAIPWAAPW